MNTKYILPNLVLFTIILTGCGQTSTNLSRPVTDDYYKANDGQATSVTDTDKKDTTQNNNSNISVTSQPSQTQSVAVAPKLQQVQLQPVQTKTQPKLVQQPVAQPVKPQPKLEPKPTYQYTVLKSNLSFNGANWSKQDELNYVLQTGKSLSKNYTVHGVGRQAQNGSVYYFCSLLLLDSNNNMTGLKIFINHQQFDDAIQARFYFLANGGNHSDWSAIELNF